MRRLFSSVAALAVSSLAMAKEGYAMMVTDRYAAPLLDYPVIAVAASFANLKTAANANITILKNALTPSTSAPASLPHSDFDQIPPATAKKLLDELTAIQATITAAT